MMTLTQGPAAPGNHEKEEEILHPLLPPCFILTIAPLLSQHKPPAKSHLTLVTCYFGKIVNEVVVALPSLDFEPTSAYLILSLS